MSLAGIPAESEVEDRAADQQRNDADPGGEANPRLLARRPQFVYSQHEIAKLAFLDCLDDLGKGTLTEQANDTRILILRAEICKLLPESNLDKERQFSCTYCCTRIEISKKLAEFIVAWPSLSKRHQDALSMMVSQTD